MTAATRALLILFAINILNFYDRQVLSTLTEPVRKEFRLSDTQIGWMTTASHIYLVEGRSSLVKCFDEVVGTCTHAAAHDLDKS